MDSFWSTSKCLMCSWPISCVCHKIWDCPTHITRIFPVVKLVQQVCRGGQVPECITNQFYRSYCITDLKLYIKKRFSAQSQKQRGSQPPTPWKLWKILRTTGKPARREQSDLFWCYGALSFPREDGARPRRTLLSHLLLLTFTNVIAPTCKVEPETHLSWAPPVDLCPAFIYSSSNVNSRILKVLCQWICTHLVTKEGLLQRWISILLHKIIATTIHKQPNLTFVKGTIC